MSGKPVGEIPTHGPHDPPGVPSFPPGRIGLGHEEEGKRVIDEKTQMGLGDYFFEDGDYYRAITEYKRFLFFFPQSLRAEEALWKITSSYFEGKKWDEALSAGR